MTSELVVLVDSDSEAWPLEIVRVLQQNGFSCSISALPSPRHKKASLLTALYAHLDRWGSRTTDRAQQVTDARVLNDQLEAATTIVDLTVTANPPLRPQHHVIYVTPKDIGPTQILKLLLAKQQTLRLEVRSRPPGQPETLETASEISLARLSAKRSSDRATARLATLITRALKGQAAGGERTEQPQPPLASSIGHLRVLRLLADAALTASRVAVTRIDWQVSYGHLPENPEDPFELPHSLTRVPAPAGHFYADPFLACDQGRSIAFVEDFDLALGRASLAAIDLETHAATTVIDEPHHLSYPLAFQVDTTWFMLPETAASGQIVLYRCERFPDAWVRDRVILDEVEAYDPTLLHFNGRWWLFFAQGTQGAASDDELHLWYADTLYGPYAPHPQNPIRSTPAGARPAGRIIATNQRLLRPGQNASAEYGGGIIISEITALTEATYAERPIKNLSPTQPGARGIHTIDRVGTLTIIDTKYRRTKRRT